MRLCAADDMHDICKVLCVERENFSQDRRQSSEEREPGRVSSGSGGLSSRAAGQATDGGGQVPGGSFVHTVQGLMYTVRAY